MPITYGAAAQPAQSIFNYDALVSTTVGLYRKQLINNISASNLFFYLMKDKGMWESAAGGLYIAEELMYGLAPTDSYDGYDILPLTPTEGITQAQFLYSQCATPVAISEKERKMNKQRIIDLVAAKVKQAEISIIEFFSRAFIQGSFAGGGTDIRLPYTSGVNGSVFVDPLFKLIATNPAASVEIGGINQSTQTWWRNYAMASAATTYDQFLAEVLHLINLCSRGPGGRPNMLWGDQLTIELLTVAYYQKFRREMEEVGNFPFPVIKFQNILVSWDQYMPDAAANTGAGAITEPLAKGTLVAMNTEFMKVRYEEETNFVAGDWDKPINQDAKYKHILWMGSVTTNQRRKQGVLSNIARTLTN